MTHNSECLTPQQAKDSLRARGMTITEWATQNKFSRADVYDVLRGRVKAHFGEAHKIAVALGIKPSTPEDAGNPRQPVAA